MKDRQSRKIKEIQGSKIYVGKIRREKRRVMGFFSPAEVKEVETIDWREAHGEISLGSINQPSDIEAIKIVVPADPFKEKKDEELEA